MKIEFTAGQVAQLLGGTVEGNADVKLSNFGKIEDAAEGEITFLANNKYEHYIYDTKASAVLVNENFTPQKAIDTTLIRVKDAYAALAELLQRVQTMQTRERKGVDDTARIDPSVQLPEDIYIGAYACIEAGVVLGKGAKIYPHVFLGEGVTVGEGTVINPHVTVYHGSSIGKRCIVHAGAVIGADGFGFAPEADGYHKIPQLGGVIIEDDVEIGANTCVDRAVMGNTVVHKGAKLDNLIQIAHNCTVGEHTVMASQAGMAGSSHIGQWCQVGGQVGISGHVTIGNKVGLGGQTGILGNVKDGSVLLGSPAMNAREAMRAYVYLPKLPEIEKRLRSLEKQIETNK